MTLDQADLIAQLAAPIYGPMLAHYMTAGRGVTEEGLAQLRATAIAQALALRRDVLEAPFPG